MKKLFLSVFTITIILMEIVINIGYGKYMEYYEVYTQIDAFSDYDEYFTEPLIELSDSFTGFHAIDLDTNQTTHELKVESIGSDALLFSNVDYEAEIEKFFDNVTPEIDEEILDVQENIDIANAIDLKSLQQEANKLQVDFDKMDEKDFNDNGESYDDCILFCEQSPYQDAEDNIDSVEASLTTLSELMEDESNYKLDWNPTESVEAFEEYVALRNEVAEIADLYTEVQENIQLLEEALYE